MNLRTFSYFDSNSIWLEKELFDNPVEDDDQMIDALNKHHVVAINCLLDSIEQIEIDNEVVKSLELDALQSQALADAEYEAKIESNRRSARALNESAQTGVQSLCNRVSKFLENPSEDQISDLVCLDWNESLNSSKPRRLLMKMVINQLSAMKSFEGWVLSVKLCIWINDDAWIRSFIENASSKSSTQSVIANKLHYLILFGVFLMSSYDKGSAKALLGKQLLANVPLKDLRSIISKYFDAHVKNEEQQVVFYQKMISVCDLPKLAKTNHVQAALSSAIQQFVRCQASHYSPQKGNNGEQLNDADLSVIILFVLDCIRHPLLKKEQGMQGPSDSYYNLILTPDSNELFSFRVSSNELTGKLCNIFRENRRLALNTALSMIEVLSHRRSYSGSEVRTYMILFNDLMVIRKLLDSLERDLASGDIAELERRELEQFIFEITLSVGNPKDDRQRLIEWLFFYPDILQRHSNFGERLAKWLCRYEQGGSSDKLFNILKRSIPILPEDWLFAFLCDRRESWTDLRKAIWNKLSKGDKERIWVRYQKNNFRVDLAQILVEWNIYSREESNLSLISVGSVECKKFILDWVVDLLQLNEDQKINECFGYIKQWLPDYLPDEFNEISKQTSYGWLMRVKQKLIKQLNPSSDYSSANQSSASHSSANLSSAVNKKKSKQSTPVTSHRSSPASHSLTKSELKMLLFPKANESQIIMKIKNKDMRARAQKFQESLIQEKLDAFFYTSMVPWNEILPEKQYTTLSSKEKNIVANVLLFARFVNFESTTDEDGYENEIVTSCQKRIVQLLLREPDVEYLINILNMEYVDRDSDFFWAEFAFQFLIGRLAQYKNKEITDKNMVGFCFGYLETIANSLLVNKDDIIWAKTEKMKHLFTARGFTWYKLLLRPEINSAIRELFAICSNYLNTITNKNYEEHTQAIKAICCFGNALLDDFSIESWSKVAYRTSKSFNSDDCEHIYHIGIIQFLIFGRSNALEESTTWLVTDHVSIMFERLCKVLRYYSFDDCVAFNCLFFCMFGQVIKQDIFHQICLGPQEMLYEDWINDLTSLKYYESLSSRFFVSLLGFSFAFWKSSIHEKKIYSLRSLRDFMIYYPINKLTILELENYIALLKYIKTKIGDSAIKNVLQQKLIYSEFVHNQLNK
jgi:hypothetical protein